MSRLEPFAKSRRVVKKQSESVLTAHKWTHLARLAKVPSARIFVQMATDLIAIAETTDFAALDSIWSNVYSEYYEWVQGHPAHRKIVPDRPETWKDFYDWPYVPVQAHVFACASSVSAYARHLARRHHTRVQQSWKKLRMLDVLIFLMPKKIKAILGPHEEVDRLWMRDYDDFTFGVVLNGL